MQGQKSLTLRWRSFSRSGSVPVTVSFAFKGNQHYAYAEQWINDFSITWFARQKIIDAPLMLIFRMGQWPSHFLLYIELQPIPHLWLSASNHHLDYPWCKSKNHWHAMDYHVQDGAGSVSLFFLVIKAANSSKKDNNTPKSIFCD